MKLSVLVASAALSLAAAACANTENTPEWALEGAAGSAPGYPDFSAVPTAIDANTNPAYWSGVENELMAARAELQANPRAEYGPPPEDPAEFLAEAREDLEATRDSH
ncbi:MAG: hypothetical protein AB7P07_02505 [Hyphomonadaceae bacterium]